MEDGKMKRTNRIKSTLRIQSQVQSHRSRPITACVIHLQQRRRSGICPPIHPPQHRQWPPSSQSATSPSVPKPANQSSRSVPLILGDSQLTCVRDVEPKPRCRRGRGTRPEGSKRERQDDALEVSCGTEYLSARGDSVSWQVSWR
jgi:hypothetical protein